MTLVNNSAPPLVNYKKFVYYFLSRGSDVTLPYPASGSEG